MNQADSEAAQPHAQLRDAHLHLAEHGAGLLTPSAWSCRNIDEVLALVAEAARQTPRDRWIVVRSLRVEALEERRFPTAAELDEAAGRGAEDGGVVVNVLDLHSLAASSAALQAAGIDRHTADPHAGVVVRDERGEPTGVLLEEAAKLMRPAIPKPSPEDEIEHVRAAVEDMKRRGYVEAHEMHARPPLLRGLRALLERDDPAARGFRLVLYAVPEHHDETKVLFDALPPNDLVRWGGLKLFTDGTLNSRTAAMLEPYADPIPSHPRGMLTYSRAELVGHVKSQIARVRERGGAAGDAGGWHHRPGVAAHAIGDAAVRQLLDVYDELEVDIDQSPEFTLRIEHVQFMHEADRERFVRRADGAVRKRPVVASPQPCHLLADVEGLTRLTPDRLDRCFPTRDLIDAARAGGFDKRDVVLFGSDTPVVDPSPDDNIQAAVHRRREDMAEAEAIGPSQAITRDEAIRLMGSDVPRE